jgi:prophage regulatory protein
MRPHRYGPMRPCEDTTMTDYPTLLRRPEVRARTGLSDTRIDELEKRGAFPRRVLISERAIGWVASEIDQFIRAKIEARDQQQPAA